MLNSQRCDPDGNCNNRCRNKVDQKSLADGISCLRLPTQIDIRRMQGFSITEMTHGGRKAPSTYPTRRISRVYFFGDWGWCDKSVTTSGSVPPSHNKSASSVTNTIAPTNRVPVMAIWAIRRRATIAMPSVPPLLLHKAIRRRTVAQNRMAVLQSIGEVRDIP